MFRRAGLAPRLLLIAVDLALTALALHLARLLRLALPFGIYLSEPLWFSPWFYLVVPTIWLVVFVALQLYYPGRALRYVADLQSLWGAVTMAMLVFSGIAYLFFRELSRLLLFYFYLLDLVFLSVWRMALPHVLPRIQQLGDPRRVLVVGAGEVGHEIGSLVKEHRWTGLKLVGFVDDDPAKQETGCLKRPVFGPLTSLEATVKEQEIDEVILALPSRIQAKTKQLVLALQTLPVNVRLVPDVFDMVFIRASVEDFAGIPLIGLREPVIEGVDRAVKRLFDIVVGGLILVLVAPVMMTAVLAIALGSPGPIFFCQQRVGESGQIFEMLKFRTMIAGAEEEERALARETGDDGPPIFEKRPDDPRITRVGHFLRRWSLDELPQLINVLKGEMSLVGPRPELPWLVEQYKPWQRKRFAVPQGMTGWWQVNGRSDRADHDLRAEDDLYYIRNWSIWLDLRILWMTAGAVIRGEGAY
jgi:exopolysaccharide biosynthesis polyprenyl glycosylphosphotransferase